MVAIKGDKNKKLKGKGRGKAKLSRKHSSKSKRSPKRKPKSKIPSNLDRWNFVRSYVALKNRQLGRKFTGKQINAFSKTILRDSWGITTITEQDIEDSLETEIPEFFSTPLTIPKKDLTNFPYFYLDNYIKTRVPLGIDVVINAGDFGISKFNTADYSYNKHAKKIVEGVRIPLKNDYDESNGIFSGFVKQYKPLINSENITDPKNYYLELILFYEGEFVSNITNNEIVPTVGEETRLLPPKKFKKAKEVLKEERRKKLNLREIRKKQQAEEVEAEVNKRLSGINESLKTMAAMMEQMQKKELELKEREAAIAEKEAKIEEKLKRIEEKLDKIAKLNKTHTIVKKKITRKPIKKAVVKGKQTVSKKNGSKKTIKPISKNKKPLATSIKKTNSKKKVIKQKPSKKTKK